MPPKEYKQEQLFFGNEEIGFRSLGEFTEVELDADCEVTGDIPLLNIGSSHEFTAKIQPPDRMTAGDVILVLYGFDIEKLKQNNWRKMHGMVMHRRLKRK